MVGLLRDLKEGHSSVKTSEEIAKIPHAQEIFDQQISAMITSGGTSLIELENQLGAGAKFNWYKQDIAPEVINLLFQLLASKKDLSDYPNLINALIDENKDEKNIKTHLLVLAK